MGAIIDIQDVGCLGRFEVFEESDIHTVKVVTACLKNEEINTIAFTPTDDRGHLGDFLGGCQGTIVIILYKVKYSAYYSFICAFTKIRGCPDVETSKYYTIFDC